MRKVLIFTLFLLCTSKGYTQNEFLLSFKMHKWEIPSTKETTVTPSLLAVFLQSYEVQLDRNRIRQLIRQRIVPNALHNPWNITKIDKVERGFESGERYKRWIALLVTLIGLWVSMIIFC